LEALYSIWIKIDKTLPWIELKGEYETKNEARQAAQIAKSKIATKLVKIPQERRLIKDLITVRAR
jgi:hypothetical protein